MGGEIVGGSDIEGFSTGWFIPSRRSKSAPGRASSVWQGVRGKEPASAGEGRAGAMAQAWYNESKGVTGFDGDHEAKVACREPGTR